MEALKVESVSACFVNMVMDRLQTLEGKHMQEVAELKEQNMQLASQVKSLQQCVYLREDLKTFSDGSVLDPGFGLFPDTLNKQVAGHIKVSADHLIIDDMHLDAVAVHGRIGVDLELEGEVDGSNTLLMVGRPGECSSVRQLLMAWNAHCVKLREDDRTPMTDIIAEYHGFHEFGFDMERLVPVYSLTSDPMDDE